MLFYYYGAATHGLQLGRISLWSADYDVLIDGLSGFVLVTRRGVSRMRLSRYF